jgi:hypothetical protein
MQTQPTTPLRRSDLEVDVMSDGYVVFDQKADRVHYLNASSALIFELCDGTSTAEEIAQAVGEAFQLPSAPLAEVETCLADLAREELINL